MPRFSTSCCPILLTLAAILAGCDRRPADPQALLAQGWEMLRVGETETAQRSFERVARDAKNPATRAAACYGRAMLYVTSTDPGDVARVRQLLDEAVSQDLNGPIAPWARLALARHVDAMHPIPPHAPAFAADDEVLKRYADVIDKYPEHPAAQEAEVMRVGRLVRSEAPVDLRRAVELAEAQLAKRPDSAWNPALCGLLANAYRSLGDPQHRVAALIRAADFTRAQAVAGGDVPDLALPYWQIATAAEFEAGDLATVREYYKRFLTEYPKDQRVLTATQALARVDRIESRLRAGEEPAVVLRQEAP